MEKRKEKKRKEKKKITLMRPSLNGLIFEMIANQGINIKTIKIVDNN